MTERKKQIFLEAYKKSKKESVMGKLANGDTDPMEPWSKKHAPLDEVNTQILWKYIKAMGRDPRTISLNDRLNLARTDRFKKFSRDHAKYTDMGTTEEVVNEAGTGLLMSFIKSKGLDPRAMDGNQRNKYSKSSEFKLFKHRKMKAETSGMGERGDDWNEEVEHINELKKQSDTQDLDSHITREDLRKWFSKTDPEGGWKRINSKGEAIGPCAREPGEPKPKCMSNEKRAKLSKKERAAAVAAKRKHDPVADRAGKGGKPVNVSNFGKGKLSKESVDEACWVTHKQVGMKKKGNKMVPDCVPKNEEIEQIDEKNSPTNPKLWARAKSLARSKFDVYPCVPLDSLAISKKGPISHEDLEIGDEILTYNMKIDELEWKPVLHKHYYENAPLLEIGKPTGFSIRCTPNHKWVISKSNGSELIETKDLNTHMKILMCSVLKNQSSLIIENWSKKDNWIEKILSMNEKEREIFLASSIVYDGWDKGVSPKIKDRHTFGFVQKEYEHLWASLLASYLNGYYVNTNNRDDMVNATYIRNKKYHSTQNLYRKDAGYEDVWCPTTENETWVMVQNGLITITGNSAYANGWASKWYKSKGGGWRATKEEVENVNEGIYGIEDSPLSANNSVKAMESKMTKEKSKSARMIKALYKKKGLRKETIYDWEKTEKNKNLSDSELNNAKMILKGGKTMTGKPRDTIEIDPVLKTKLNMKNGSNSNSQ